MKDHAKVIYNPLKLFVYTLVISFIFGEILNTYFKMPIVFNFIGLLFLIIFLFIFLFSVRFFFINDELPPPSTPTKKIIKNGIYAFSRNPIYLAFIGFQMSMFFLFENIFYFLSSIGLFIWIHFFAVLPEEDYLSNKFGEEYEEYKKNVPRWVIFN